MTIALWVSAILTLLGILAGVIKLVVDQKSYLVKLVVDERKNEKDTVKSENELSLKLLELLRSAEQAEKIEASRSDDAFRQGFIELIAQHNELMTANQKVLLDAVRLTTELEHERLKTDSLTLRVSALEKQVPELNELIIKQCNTIEVRDASIALLNTECKALKSLLAEEVKKNKDLNAEASIALRAQERAEGALIELHHCTELGEENYDTDSI